MSSWFLLLTATVGLNQLLLMATGHCPASILIEWRPGRRHPGALRT